MNRKQLVTEFMSLALKLSETVKDLQFSVNFQCSQVHAYTFKEGVETAEYDLNFFGYYSDWCEPKEEESIENAISQIKEHLS